MYARKGYLFEKLVTESRYCATHPLIAVQPRMIYKYLLSRRSVPPTGQPSLLIDQQHPDSQSVSCQQGGYPPFFYMGGIELTNIGIRNYIAIIQQKRLFPKKWRAL